MSAWSPYIQKSKEIQKLSIAPNSKHTYDHVITNYQNVAAAIGATPEETFPITEDSMRGFLIYLKDSRYRTFNTLHNQVAGFSHYFKMNNLPDLTKSIPFKEFMKGLRREMNGNSVPYQKEPFTPEMFEQMLEKKPPNTKDDTNFYLLMSMMYFGFLRISEALNLTWNDLKISNNSITFKKQSNL